MKNSNRKIENENSTQKDNLWFLQCIRPVGKFKSGNVYRILNKNTDDWELSDGKLNFKIIRANFIPVTENSK